MTNAPPPSPAGRFQCCYVFRPSSDFSPSFPSLLSSPSCLLPPPSSLIHFPSSLLPHPSSILPHVSPPSFFSPSASTKPSTVASQTLFRGVDGSRRPAGVPGYLAHIKTPPPPDHYRTRQRPTLGSWGEALSYERGTPVGRRDHSNVSELR